MPRILTLTILTPIILGGCGRPADPEAAAPAPAARPAPDWVAETTAEAPTPEPEPIPEPDPVEAKSVEPEIVEVPIEYEPAPALPDPVVEKPRPEERPVAADPLERLLDELEESGRTLEAFTAKVWYRIDNAFVGRPETRIGELLFTRAGGPSRFAILFERTVIGGRLEEDRRHYVFDGQWLAEINEADKQFTKTQIVPPGRELDPLKLGEGPFPVPIGQPKQQVLARFDVERTTLPAEGPLVKLAGLFQLEGLRLVPKPHTAEARDFERVDLFYDTKTMLPVGIVVAQAGGKIKTVRLTEPRRNPVLDEAELKKLDIAEPDPAEWAVVVQPWKER